MMPEIPTTVKNKGLVEKRREQIVRAAIKQFSQKGFHKTTLRELAEEAGLSAGTIYEYVGSKEDIFFLIHELAADLAEVALDRSIENINDPIEKLSRMVRAEFNNMNEWADAIMLLYQESHILQGPYLRKLLQRERAHLAKFESVIEECINAGLLRDCNIRMSANLIKSMVDTWVIKRWDLRRHADRLEAERSILDLVFYGMLKRDEFDFSQQREVGGLGGKCVLIVNSETVLGSAICSILTSRGARVAAYSSQTENKHPPVMEPSCKAQNVLVYPARELGPLSDKLLKRIENDLGTIDVYIHDMGIGNTNVSDSRLSSPTGHLLQSNLTCAQSIVPFMKNEILTRASGRIIYLAPWAWDYYANPTFYEIAREGTIALTHAMTKLMSSSGVNVNCIIPGFIKAARPTKVEKELTDDAIPKIPLGLLGEISDVTDAVTYLAGDVSKYLTGQVLRITGGIQ